MEKLKPFYRALNALTVLLAMPLAGVAHNGAYFNDTDSILYLPEVDAGSLGIYNVSLKLANTNPVTFSLSNAIKAESTGNPIARYQSATGALSILSAKAGTKRYKADLKTVGSNFELVSATEIADDLASSKSVLINGKIYTVNPQQPWVEAVYIENGVISYAGDSQTAKTRAGETANVIDLKGMMAMPGIHDVHTHPLEAASLFAGTCDLRDINVSSAEDYIPVLRQCAPQQIGTHWVLGAGHSVFTLLDSQRTPLAILDEAIPDKPVVIMEETSHSVWVNSKALDEAGIDKNTANPPGGVIVKDPLTNAPVGILFDSAGDLVMDFAWLPTDTIKQLNYDGLLDALFLLNKHGITSLCEARTYWKRGFQDAWLRAEQENTLTVRAILALWAYPSMADSEQLSAVKALYRNNPNDLLRISQIKLYNDGILINSTAAMLAPYLENAANIPSDNGLNYFTEERLTRYITELEPLGFDFHIHAIGDRGVRESINAIEAAQSSSGRHRLTHLEVVSPVDYPRFKSLNITADMQVAGSFSNPEHWAENEFLIGNRANNLIPLKSLYDAGARITLSSDWDVSALSPFVGMQNALTRTPQNLPDLAAVIQAYTLNPAYVMRQETKTGSIEAGKEADLIVLDRNLFEIPVQSISQTQVLMTFLQGNMVYEKK